MKNKFKELRYWYIYRPSHNLFVKLTHKIPKKVRYWVIIHTLNEYYFANPNKEVDLNSVSGNQLLDIVDYGRKS